MGTELDGVNVTEWGHGGPRVVLIHGGTPGGGAQAFASQEPLKERWRILLPDRPGHGLTPKRGGEDFERDATILQPLLEPGTHLVGQSYGGMVALYMAQNDPDAVASLTLIEAPAFCFAMADPVVADMARRNRELFTNPPEDPVVFMRSAFAMLGIAVEIPEPPPDFFVDIATAFKADATDIRVPDEAVIDVQKLAEAGFPVLTMTSGLVPGFDHIADAVADQLGGSHVVVPGTDHSVQNAGAPVNAMLEELWRSAR